VDTVTAAIDPVVRRLVLCAGLPSGTVAEPVELTDAAVTWSSTHKLTGLLAETLRSGAGLATDAVETAAAEQHALAMARDLVLERALLETVATLRAAEIEPCVLKGAAVAHLDYPDPSWRSFSDVDLLVRSSDYDRAVSVLIEAGHRRMYPEPRPGFDRRFGKGTVLQAPAGHEVDLHRSFAMGPFGVLLDLETLWAGRVSFELGGTDLSALSAPGRTLHAAFQVAIDGQHRRLSTVRDLAGMLSSPDLDGHSLARLAVQCRAEAVLERALDSASKELGRLEFELPVWRRRRRDRRWLALYDDPRTNYAALSIAAVSALPRLRDRLAMATALAAPSGPYVHDRHSSRYQRLRRNVRGVLRGLRR
jgi:hypothetical protein